MAEPDPPPIVSGGTGRLVYDKTAKVIRRESPPAGDVAVALAVLQEAPDKWGDNSLFDMLNEKHRRLLVQTIAQALATARAEGVAQERKRCVKIATAHIEESPFHTFIDTGQIWRATQARIIADAIAREG